MQATLSRLGHPKGGRPRKVDNPHRWQLIVDREVRDRADARARAERPDATDPLPDLLREFLARYAAGTPTAHATETTDA